MNAQQWNEFLDKLDFVHLSGQWEHLPLRWLDEDLPDSASPAAKDLVEKLLAIDEKKKKKRLELIQEACEAYRTELGKKSLILDSRLSPPGSRVTLRHIDPQNLGEGDCLITTGPWDRLGHLVLELASPGGEQVEEVGSEPLRVDPGELSFRNILLFPDKGTPSPRAFRALCEKVFVQARSLGARTLKVTHLHLPQTGLADRFAAAELVSAIRQILRESPGTRVDILVFSHRNFEDYAHWFESLKELAANSQPKDEQSNSVPSENPESSNSSESPMGEAGDAFRNFAQRSSDFAAEAGSSVSRWFFGTSQGTVWREPSYEELRRLNELYLGRATEAELDSGPDDLLSLYLELLNACVLLEGAANYVLPAELEKGLEDGLQSLNPGEALYPYFLLLQFRIDKARQREPQMDWVRLQELAEQWEDRPLSNHAAVCGQEEPGSEQSKRTPVFPRGIRGNLTEKERENE